MLTEVFRGDAVLDEVAFEQQVQGEVTIAGAVGPAGDARGGTQVESSDDTTSANDDGVLVFLCRRLADGIGIADVDVLAAHRPGCCQGNLVAGLSSTHLAGFQILNVVGVVDFGRQLSFADPQFQIVHVGGAVQIELYRLDGLAGNSRVVGFHQDGLIVGLGGLGTQAAHAVAALVVAPPLLRVLAATVEEDDVEAALNYLDNHPNCALEDYEAWLTHRENAIKEIEENKSEDN